MCVCVCVRARMHVYGNMCENLSVGKQVAAPVCMASVLLSSEM